MSSEATCSVGTDSDNLRRSKRKKFCLDVVAAAHGNNQKKSKRDAHEEEEDDYEEEFDELSVQTDLTVLDESDYEEEDALSKRRTRRSTAHWGDYQEQFVDWVDQSGSFACSKCPSRYESRSSLSNHSKMHTGERRKFACELCDFSSSTQKSLVLHNNIHKRYGVISAQTSPAIVAIPHTTAPDLMVAEVQDNEVDEDEMPPVLQRESSPPVLVAEVAPVRKSGRPSKASKRSGTPGSTPRKYQVKQQKPEGSLPRSSSSSSATPPLKESPVPPVKLPVAVNLAKSLKAVESKKSKAASPEQEKATPPQKSEKPPKRFRKCPQCPFTATSTTKLNKHAGGHRLAEGFRCPAPNCNYTCRTAGFLQRHYTVHPEQLPWPPAYVGIETVERKPKNEKVEISVLSTSHPRQMAQLRSHKVLIEQSGAPVKQCNIGECTFQTVSKTQLILHKSKAHQTSASTSHKFLCITCGFRAKTYSALRVHKLTRHAHNTSRRFHRTYYLKEMVGDKFFIKYYATGAPAEQHEGDESGDESFDSGTATANTSANSSQLAEAIAKDPASVFCCNLCPYQAPTMNRCQRHYDKHFAPAPFKCRYCSWSSRSQEVLAGHEKLHEPQSEEASVDQEKEEVKTEKEEEAGQKSPVKNGTEPKEIFACPETASLGASLHAWCTREKSRRPELDDQFTRKIIDGVKGFQCVDCPYISKYRGDMRSHKKRHDIEQMYRCVQCTYTTNRPVSLKDHMKQHLPVNQMLRKVTPLLVNQGNNIGHIRGVGKDRIYSCNKCPYVTTTLGCMWRHYRNHRHVAKFYICSNCTYSSIEMRKMEEHCVIHTAFGENEPIPFVKRVDQEGNPVSSLTDLNSDKMERKLKRKLLQGQAGPNPESHQNSEERTPMKRKRRSNDSTPRATESPQPTRQLSDRATRSKHNYSVLLTRGDLTRHTPVKNNIDQEVLEPDETIALSHDETIQVTHWRIRNYLSNEFPEKEIHKCPKCPFQNPDAAIIEQHLFFHTPTEPPRPYSCCDCSFTTFTPTSLLQHLKVHSEGVYYDPQMRKMLKHRKSDTIPAGMKGYSCNTCNYKTLSHQLFVEHSAYHRHQLASRMSVTMKRAPPKEDYQRPKLKHQFVARNAKYCKKCTFKCISTSSFIEHVDRHGWGQLYKCHVCDYSDNNKSIVEFHQINHHIFKDQTLHSVVGAVDYRLENGAILEPESGRPKPTADEFAKKSRGLLKCGCCDFFCHVASELAFHMSTAHGNEPDVRETISYLHMGLVPPQAAIKSI